MGLVPKQACIGVQPDIQNGPVVMGQKVKVSLILFCLLLQQALQVHLKLVTFDFR